MSSSKFASDSLQGQITSVQSENEKAKAEVKEVLQALEELAMNYDQKLQEVDNRNKENDKLQDDLTSKQVAINLRDFARYFLSLLSSHCLIIIFLITPICRNHAWSGAAPDT